jgi:hypothetical protein
LLKEKVVTKERSGTDPHLYGTPDPKNPPAPAIGGLRGEKHLSKNEDNLEHVERLGDRDVTIEETSGVAFAEAKLDQIDEDDPHKVEKLTKAGRKNFDPNEGTD